MDFSEPEGEKSMCMVKQLKGQVSIENVLLRGEENPEKPKWVLITGSRYLWCPICKDVMEFKRDHRLGIPRCEGCGMSIRDFHVRQKNKLFTKEALK